MKKIVWLLLLTGTFLSAQELPWQKDVQTAFEKAKTENKTVMLMVEAAYCKWCKKMKRETLSDPEVQKRLQPYVPVKILRNDQEAMKNIPEGYYAAPTILFMTPEKEMIVRVIGYFDVLDFLSYIDDVEKAKMEKKAK